MIYRPLPCGCGPEYQCSKCRTCYSCKHKYFPSGSGWRAKCPTGRIRPAFPDTKTQERVALMREQEEMNMGGTTYEQETEETTKNTDTTSPAPSTDSEPQPEPETVDASV